MEILRGPLKILRMLSELTPYMTPYIIKTRGIHNVKMVKQIVEREGGNGENIE